jgi:hypothetical protein
MQITLSEDEIQQAVVAFVRGQITIAENQQIDVNFTAGRAPNGLTATLQISTVVASQAKPMARSMGQVGGTKAPAPVANISTGEERVPVMDTAPDADPAQEVEQDEPACAEEEPATEEPLLVKKTGLFSKATTANVDEAPEAVEDEKPAAKSIFSKTA